jgi:curved DNA-binding protein
VALQNRPLDASTARRILGVAPNAGPAELRRAFSRAVKASHPDRHGGDGERLRQVIEAYRWLDAAIPRSVSAPAAPRTEAACARLTITVAEALLGGWTRVAPGDGEALSVRLPAGLRAGDLVRVSGRTFQIALANGPEASICGDDLLMTASIGRAMAEAGGRLLVETPANRAMVWISRLDVARGFVRIAGLGLPARGARPQGDLLLRLKALSTPDLDSPAQAKRRRFAAAWAA